MKSIIIVRHAKSGWENPLQQDFDRPLNERGEKDAPAMAKRLVEQSIPIDAFISSPAKRALTTARHFATAYGIEKEKVLQVPELYHAPMHVFYDVIAAIDNRYNSIAVFSHNGGITDFVNTLTKTKIDNMPTCAVFAVKADIDNWNEFFGAEKSFWFFDYPKK